MNKGIKIVLIAICLAAICNCESSWGSCPNFKYELDSFNLREYLGKWYEIARHKSTPFQKGDCTTAEYSLKENGNVKVLNSEWINGEKSFAEGEANTTSDPFRLQVRFGDSFIAKLFKGDYRVVDTDYKSYSLVYSCTDFFFGKFYFVWILSREPTLPEVTYQRLLSQIETKFGISRDQLRVTKQSGDVCINRQTDI